MIDKTIAWNPEMAAQISTETLAELAAEGNAFQRTIAERMRALKARVEKLEAENAELDEAIDALQPLLVQEDMIKRLQVENAELREAIVTFAAAFRLTRVDGLGCEISSVNNRQKLTTLKRLLDFAKVEK
jgi:hypothetical protein